MTDPIADMLTRIRNAIAVGKADVSLPHSRLKEALARLLKDNGFLFGVGVEGEDTHKNASAARQLARQAGRHHRD